MTDRRRFLEFLVASPLLAGIPFEALAQSATLKDVDSLIGSAADALNVFDMEPVAHRNIPPAHWGYLASGVDGDGTIQANRDAYARYQLRTRRLVDMSKQDMSRTLFGTAYASPIYLCPLGAQKAFHPEGEIASARAAKAKNQLQVLSTVASNSPEAVTAARGAPIWFQLYHPSRWDAAVTIVKRAEAAGCPVMMLTVDLPAGRNAETAARLARTDTRTCSACHMGAPNASTGSRGRPIYDGIDMTGVFTQNAAMTWDAVKRLRDVTRMKIMIKGLESGFDAALAVKAGADGVVVSNHGGRATDTGRGTLESLPEVVAAVKGNVPVYLDGGIRRGTDVLKALALGATAVGIGRPYIWGLGAFGQPGVERVLDILNAELRLAMAGVGARTLSEITPAALIRKT